MSGTRGARLVGSALLAAALVLAMAAPAAALPVHSPRTALTTTASPTANQATTSASADPMVVGYITRVYADLFGRGVDAGGLAAWSAQLAAGTPRIAVASAITGSEEYRGQLIRAAYEAHLSRAPDPGGRTFWLGQMGIGMTIQQMEAGFLASDEYFQQAGGTPAGWIDALYGDVLKRSAGPSEVSYWLGQLARGSSRFTVSLGFFMSTEHLTTQVDAQYQVLLGRGIDPSGSASWVSLIQRGARFEAVIGGIVASSEYWSNIPGHSMWAWGDNTTGQFGNGSYVSSPTITRLPAGRAWLEAGAGANIGAALRNDGTVWWWGSTGARLQPSPVKVASGFVDISVGRNHVMALDRFGRLYGWGWCLGIGAHTNETWVGAPTEVFGGHHWRSMDAGSNGTVAIAADGSIWEWGDVGGTIPLIEPRQVSTDTDWVSVNAGGRMYAIKADGTLWIWGRHGRIDGTADPEMGLRQVGVANDWIQVSSGGNHDLGVRADGSLWAWGLNAGGELGTGNLVGSDEPVRVGTDNDWLTSEAGWSTSAAIRQDGSLWTWGTGELGDGATARLTPGRIGSDTDWISVAMELTYALALRR